MLKMLKKAHPAVLFLGGAATVATGVGVYYGYKQVKARKAAAAQQALADQQAAAAADATPPGAIKLNGPTDRDLDPDVDPNIAENSGFQRVGSMRGGHLYLHGNGRAA